MHSFDSASWGERSAPVDWTCMFLLRRSAGITGQADRARARSAHYPDEAKNWLQHQRVREKESPSNRLRTLHLTRAMISIRCAAAEGFYGSMFQRVRKIKKRRAGESRVEIAWAEHFLPFLEVLQGITGSERGSAQARSTRNQCPATLCGGQRTIENSTGTEMEYPWPKRCKSKIAP